MRRRWFALTVIVMLTLIGMWGCKKASTPNAEARVFIHSQGQIGTFTYVSGEPYEIRTSDYSGVDADHIIVRRPNMGARIGFTKSGGVLTVTLPEGGVDVFLLRAGSRYSGVEAGKLKYGRNPTWNWRYDAEGYIPNAEEVSYIENLTNEFSAYLSSIPSLIYGSVAKTNSGGTIEQLWYSQSGGSYAKRASNVICYNTARMSPNTALGRAVVHEELLEMLIGLDDIFGGDSRLDLCDAAGNPTQEYKDLLFYVFVKE